MTITIDILKQFCLAKDDLGVRAWMQAPWSRGEYSYATNRHVMLRVPRLAGVMENPKAVKVDHLFPALDGLMWLPLPVVKPPQQVACGWCDGKGNYGEPKGHSMECDECDGSGEVIPIVRIAVGGVDFQAIYFAWLSRLPRCEIAPNGQGKPAAIRFDGGVGAIMPLRP